MEKVKNVEKENEIENKESKSEIEKIEELKAKLFVTREQFIGSEGGKFWSYCLKNEIRGRKVKVDFVPKDKGGYEVLDILFDISDKAELFIQNGESIDKNGKKNKFTTFILKVFDEDNICYECPVVTYQSSDKSLLKMILRKNGIEIY